MKFNFKKSSLNADRTKKDKDTGDNLGLKEIIKTVAGALILSAVIIQFVGPTIVNGSSMYPTLENGDYLYMNKVSNIDKNDIVVFDTHAKQRNMYIKRVIATGGDAIKIKDSKVYVNGEELEEHYILEQEFWGEMDEVIVPKDKLFVLGDNRNNSTDSRYLGFIDKADVVGEVFIRLFPFSKLGKP